MLQNNQIIKTKITKVDHHGTAIVDYKRDRIFVSNVLPQEEVNIKIGKRIKEGYVGKVIQIHKANEIRVKPQCGIYQNCGSCHFLHMKYEEQLKSKKRHIQNLCEQEHLSIHVHDVVGMQEPYAYRNKIIVGFKQDKQRNIIAGFYEEFSHHIIPFEHCLLHDEICDRIIQSIVKMMKKFRMEPYDEDRKKGLLRHVVLRKAKTTNEIMVVLVFGQKLFPGAKNFVSALTKEYPQITTVIQNINLRKTSVVLGDEERVLYGPGFIEDQLCNLRFRISSKSFYQINHDQCEVLYKKAIDLLAPKGNEVLIDAYCGIGTIGMYASSRVKEVIGVEINKEAIQDAQKNAKFNQVKNIRFLCDDASKFMVKLAADHKHIDAIIMDPPRSGSNEEFMDAVHKLNPENIIYISCDPVTQIRDLKYFKTLGYHTKDMYLYDMFPNTYHVESIVHLSKFHKLVK